MSLIEALKVKAESTKEAAHLRALNNDLEARFCELQQYANELEGKIVAEKSKAELDKRASASLRSKCDQVQVGISRKRF